MLYGPVPELSRVEVERIVRKILIRDLDRCWYWQGAAGRDDRGQYRTVLGCFNVARLICAHFHSTNMRGLVAAHTCDNPWCVNPSHVYPSTQAQNIRDSHSKGRSAHQRAQGSSCGRAKLDEAKVLAMRDDLANGATRAECAARYGISRDAVAQIQTRKTWKHI